jgi:hypothetical protein
MVELDPLGGGELQRAARKTRNVVQSMTETHRIFAQPMRDL